MRVQHRLDDDENTSEDDCEGITCQACAGVHFVNRKGKVLAATIGPPAAFPESLVTQKTQQNNTYESRCSSQKENHAYLSGRS